MSIEFKLTRDPKLLEQYYDLRERCFREELGLSDFNGSEEELDRQGHIVLAIENGRCIGGARISPNIQLRSQVRQLALKQDICCMWERFVFDPAVRTVQVIRNFFSHLVAFTKEVGFDHAMVLSSLINARFYRKFSTPLGVEFQIHRHVPHSAKGAFAGLEHYLSVANLQDAQPLMATADAHMSVKYKVVGIAG
jgi:hypothetical protein